jgi:hypothetical protein
MSFCYLSLLYHQKFNLQRWNCSGAGLLESTPLPSSAAPDFSLPYQIHVSAASSHTTSFPTDSTVLILQSLDPTPALMETGGQLGIDEITISYISSALKLQSGLVHVLLSEEIRESPKIIQHLLGSLRQALVKSLLPSKLIIYLVDQPTIFIHHLYALCIELGREILFLYCITSENDPKIFNSDQVPTSTLSWMSNVS